MLNSRATAAQADPEALHQAVAVIDSVLADLDAGRISADTAAKTIGLKVLTAREVVLEALRATQNDGAAASEWRPIETAPRDGKSFLAAHEKSGVRQITWYGKTSHVPLYGWAISPDGDTEEVDLWSPTHWQPLQDPPAFTLAQPDPSQESGTGGERS